jgi:hypothetical protein
MDGTLTRARARARAIERTHSVEDGEPELREVRQEREQVHVLEVRYPEHLDRIDMHLGGV